MTPPKATTNTNKAYLQTQRQHQNPAKPHKPAETKKLKSKHLSPATHT
jgi:hypothetical protein